MPRITVLPHLEYAPEGASFEASPGQSVCDAMHEHGVDIDHACGKVGACTTCHVVVTKGFDTLNAVEESEEDMLDRAWGLQPHSRLSCQAQTGTADLEVEIPKYSINHAKEDT